MKRFQRPWAKLPTLHRTPFRNNTRLVLASTLGALGVFVFVEVLLRKSRDFSPDFLASVLLYGLTVLNLTLLLILLFVLGRNLVRVLMERRRGVLGARFRMRLLLVFLVMAVTPSLMLIVVGSELIQQTVDRWFSVDVERMLSSSQALSTALREAVAERARGLLAEGDNGRFAAPVYLTLVWCLRELRRYREALDAAEEGLSRAPDAVLARWASEVEEELADAQREEC